MNLIDSRDLHIEQIKYLNEGQFAMLVQCLEIDLVKEYVQNEHTSCIHLAYLLQEELVALKERLQDPETAELVKNGSISIIIREYFGYGDDLPDTYLGLHNLDNTKLTDCKKYLDTTESHWSYSPSYNIGSSILDLINDNNQSSEEDDAVELVGADSMAFLPLSEDTPT